MEPEVVCNLQLILRTITFQKLHRFGGVRIKAKWQLFEYQPLVDGKLRVPSGENSKLQPNGAESRANSWPMNWSKSNVGAELSESELLSPDDPWLPSAAWRSRHSCSTR